MDFVVVPGLAGFLNVFDEDGVFSDAGIEFLQYRCDLVPFDEDDESSFGVSPSEVAEQLIELLIAPLRTVPDAALCYEQVAVVVAVEDICLPVLVKCFSSD